MSTPHFLSPQVTAGGDIRQEQFIRETNLPYFSSKDDYPTSFIIIGLGGIGGHVAEIIGSIAKTNYMLLIDPDIIELSNLNRTVFRYEHIGSPKVEAVAELIAARNIEVKTTLIQDKFDADCLKMILEEDKIYNEISNSMRLRNIIVFDCRDDFFDDYGLIRELCKKISAECKIIRAAYDGFSITIDGKPEEHPVWDDGQPAGYRTIVSHSIPARLVATLAVIMSQGYSMDSIIHPMTFDIIDILDYISMGIFIRNLDPTNKAKLEIYDKFYESVNTTKNKPSSGEPIQPFGVSTDGTTTNSMYRR